MTSFILIFYVVISLYSVFVSANETTEGEPTRQSTINYTMERRKRWAPPKPPQRSLDGSPARQIWQNDDIKAAANRARKMEAPTPPRRFGDDVQNGCKSPNILPQPPQNFPQPANSFPKPSELRPPPSAADIPPNDENYCSGIYCANFRPSGNNKNNEFPMNRGSDAVEEQVQQPSPPVIILVRSLRGNSQTGMASDDVPPPSPPPPPQPGPPRRRGMSKAIGEPLSGVVKMVLNSPSCSNTCYHNLVNYLYRSNLLGTGNR